MGAGAVRLPALPRARPPHRAQLPEALSGRCRSQCAGRYEPRRDWWFPDYHWGDVTFRLDGISVAECPVSLITPRSMWLVQLLGSQSRVKEATGAALFGPHSGRWPAWCSMQWTSSSVSPEWRRKQQIKKTKGGDGDAHMSLKWGRLEPESGRLCGGAHPLAAYPRFCLSRFGQFWPYHQNHLKLTQFLVEEEPNRDAPPRSSRGTKP